VGAIDAFDEEDRAHHVGAGGNTDTDFHGAPPVSFAGSGAFGQSPRVFLHGYHVSLS
jgi:hypothetical protein